MLWNETQHKELTQQTMRIINKTSHLGRIIASAMRSNFWPCLNRRWSFSCCQISLKMRNSDPLYLVVVPPSFKNIVLKKILTFKIFVFKADYPFHYQVQLYTLIDPKSLYIAGRTWWWSQFWKSNTCSSMNILPGSAVLVVVLYIT